MAKKQTHSLYRLKKECGISLMWLCRVLGYSSQYLEFLRDRGFTKEQANDIEVAIKNCGYKLIKYKIPKEEIVEPVKKSKKKRK